MSLKIAYLIPEFPGQTHIFFWREIQRIEQMGVELTIFSTRKPPRKLSSHAWSSEAERRCCYLSEPRSLGKLVDVLRAASGFPLRRWLDVLRSIARSEGLGVVGKAKLTVFALVGALLARQAHQRGIAHLHVHSAGNSANIALYCHLLSGLPYSLTLHGPLSDYGANQRQKWQQAAFGIVITQRLFDEVLERLGPALGRKLQIAPMGVNLDVFRRTRAYRPALATETARLFSVGRLNVCKGHDDLIRAVGVLKGRRLRIHLRIAGEDEQGGTGYHVELARLISSLHLDAEVQLLGAVAEDVVLNGLLDSHLFVLASLGEPLGVAIMEAMALEMPVVVTRGGGVTELVHDGIDGLLVDPRNPGQLADAIERVLHDPDLASGLAQASRQTIARAFADTRSAEMLVRLASPPAQQKPARTLAQTSNL